MKIVTTHSIKRTSAKGSGQKFVGTCRLCGKQGLSVLDVTEECPNPRGLSEAEALLEAFEEEETRAWADREDELTSAILDDFRSRDADYYTRHDRAMGLVGNRHSKSSLVRLVCYLLKKPSSPAREEAKALVKDYHPHNHAPEMADVAARMAAFIARHHLGEKP